LTGKILKKGGSNGGDRIGLNLLSPGAYGRERTSCCKCGIFKYRCTKVGKKKRGEARTNFLRGRPRPYIGGRSKGQQKLVRRTLRHSAAKKTFLPNSRKDGKKPLEGFRALEPNEDSRTPDPQEECLSFPIVSCPKAAEKGQFSAGIPF